MTRLQEKLSALLDDELADEQLGAAMAALPARRKEWRCYQLVGDALRASVEGAEPGPGFAARLAQRLDREQGAVDAATTAAAEDSLS